MPLLRSIFKLKHRFSRTYNTLAGCNTGNKVLYHIDGWNLNRVFVLERVNHTDLGYSLSVTQFTCIIYTAVFSSIYLNYY